MKKLVLSSLIASLCFASFACSDDTNDSPVPCSTKDISKCDDNHKRVLICDANPTDGSLYWNYLNACHSGTNKDKQEVYLGEFCNPQTDTSAKECYQLSDDKAIYMISCTSNELDQYNSLYPDYKCSQIKDDLYGYIYDASLAPAK